MDALVLKQSDFKDDEQKVCVYRTHDNGGRPFQVVIDSYYVDIEVDTSEWSCRSSEVYEPFKTFSWDDIEEIYIGTDDEDGEFFIGNSILIKLRLYQENIPKRGSKTMFFEKKEPVKHWYVHVGSDIYQFFTDTPIIEYHSLGGNNDVPYPIAVSENKVYFMLDYCYSTLEDIRKISPDYDDWYDGYRFFYDNEDKLLLHVMNGFKKWKNRIGFSDGDEKDIDISNTIKNIEKHNNKLLNSKTTTRKRKKH